MTAKKSTPAPAAKDPQKEKALETTKSLVKNDVVAKFAETKMVMINSVDDLVNKIVRGMDTLRDVDIAIAAKKDHLAEVNNIEVEANTLAELLAEQEKVRTEWQREKADYAYNLKKEREHEEDNWERQKEEKERVFNQRLQDAAEEMSNREKALVAQEAEIAEMRKLVAEFPAKLEKAVADKEKEVSNSLGREYHFKSTIANKDFEAKIGLLEQTNKTLTARIVELEKDLGSAREMQKDSLVRVQNIAERAIEGASKTQTVVIPGQSENSVRKS